MVRRSDRPGLCAAGRTAFGTLTFADPRLHTPAEALDILNQMLWVKGYEAIVARNTLSIERPMDAESGSIPQSISIVRDIQLGNTAPKSKLAKGVSIGKTKGDEGALTLQFYPIPYSDPESILAVMQTLLAGEPGVRLGTDSKTGCLMLLAAEEHHEKIASVPAMRYLDEDALRVVYRGYLLRGLDPLAAKWMIEDLWESHPVDSVTAALWDNLAPNSPVSRNPIKVIACVDARSLVIHGTARQVDAIEEFLRRAGKMVPKGQAP